MSTAARSASTRRGRRDKFEYLVGALVLLAVVASVLAVVFSDNTRVLLLAVVAALWAAVIASIAMTRSRREAATARARANDLKTVYDLELEREVTARRMYEYQVERTVREEIRTSTSNEVAELRDELRALRENLAALLGGELMVERVALRAESTRLRSLSDTARMAAGGPEALEHRRDVEDAVVEDEPHAAAGTGGDARSDGAERTDVFPKIVDESDVEPLVAERDPDPETPPAVRDESTAEPEPAEQQPAEAEPVEPEVDAVEPEVTEPEVTEPEVAESAAAPTAEGGRRRRRVDTADEQAADQDVDGAADAGAAEPAGSGDPAQTDRSPDGDAQDEDEDEGAHSAGRSVSDLIAAYGASAGAATGRRRRAE